MFVPEQYQGFDQNYLADIALIATVKSFKLTAWVQPVCIDWQKNYDRLILDEKKKRVILQSVSGTVVEVWFLNIRTGTTLAVLSARLLSPTHQKEDAIVSNTAFTLSYTITLTFSF
jgi:predicted alpha/beta hydrolase family esterase